MALDTHTSGRGGRKARKINDDRRKSDRLKSDGVLHNDETLANRVYAEAINCPICHKRVHPTNFNQHMSNDHPNGKPLHEVTERLPLAAIRTDGGTQPRAAINAETITEYAEAIQDGATFPALVVYYDGKDYWLADGFHRYHAAKQCGLLDFPADVRQGTVRDAVLHSVGANATHGLQRTNQDKRRAVERLLRDDEWAKWSDREIARRCGVSHNFVSERRKSLPATQSKVTFPSSSLSSDDSEKRTYTTKHGTQATMKVGKIGKSTPQPSPLTPLPQGEGNNQDGRVFVDVQKSGAVTYSTEVDTYIEDEGDTYVEDVPSVEVGELTSPPNPLSTNGEGEQSLLSGGLYEGAMVKAVSGQTGRVVNLSGRLVTVATRNGERVYDEKKLTLIETPDAAGDGDTIQYGMTVKTLKGDAGEVVSINGHLVQVVTPNGERTYNINNVEIISETLTSGPVSAIGTSKLGYREQRDALNRLRWVLHDSYEFMRTHGLLAANTQTTQIAKELKQIFGDDAEERFQAEMKRKRETRLEEQQAENARPRARSRAKE